MPLELGDGEKPFVIACAAVSGCCDILTLSVGLWMRLIYDCQYLQHCHTWEAVAIVNGTGITLGI